MPEADTKEARLVWLWTSVEDPFFCGAFGRSFQNGLSKVEFKGNRCVKAERLKVPAGGLLFSYFCPVTTIVAMRILLALTAIPVLAFLAGFAVDKLHTWLNLSEFTTLILYTLIWPGIFWAFAYFIGPDKTAENTATTHQNRRWVLVSLVIAGGIVAAAISYAVFWKQERQEAKERGCAKLVLSVKCDSAACVDALYNLCMRAGGAEEVIKISDVVHAADNTRELGF